jgi:hypothetical protein
MFFVHSLINDNNIDNVMVFTVSLLSTEHKRSVRAKTDWLGMRI